MAWSIFGNGTGGTDGPGIKSSTVNENFNRSVLMIDESTVDTTTYSEGTTTPTLKRTYTLTPDITNAIPFQVQIDCNLGKDGGGGGSAELRFDITDGTFNRSLVLDSANNTTFRTATVGFAAQSHILLIKNFNGAQGGLNGTTLDLEMYLNMSTAGANAQVKDVQVTFFYWQGGRVTTSSSRITNA